jgi:hypothetical protein
MDDIETAIAKKLLDNRNRNSKDWQNKFAKWRNFWNLPSIRSVLRLQTVPILICDSVESWNYELKKLPSEAGSHNMRLE